MKPVLQFVAFAVIVVVGFWIGMQWGSSARDNYRPSTEDTTPQPPVSTIVPVIVPAQDTPVIPPVEGTPAETPQITPTPVITNTAVDPNLPTKVTDKVNHYSNSNFRYEFDIPGNVYYAGFGAVDGARHTVGIAKEDPATLADAAVRVYFYGKKVVPELQNATNGKYEDPAGTYVYLLIDNAYSVKIEAVNINHPIVQKIIETIRVF